MKKVIKIIGITLASLVGVSIIAIIVVFCLLLSPSRLTPIVKEQAKNFISCQISLEEVELTVFETFPDIGLKIKNLQLINPLPNIPNDTLASIEYCTIGLNISELIKNNSIIIQQFHLKNGFANLFIDSLGKANYDILTLDTTDKSESSFKIEHVDIKKVTVENLQLAYTNTPSKIQAETKNLNLSVKGQMQDEKIEACLKLKSGSTVFQLHDSLPISASVSGLNTKFEGNIEDFNEIDGLLQLALNDVSFSMDDTQYVEAMQLALSSPLRLMLDNEYFETSNTGIIFNKHEINLNGNLSHNAENGNVDVDMAFKTNTWDIEEILQLLPYSITSLIPEMDIAGNLKLNGTATGTYNESTFPVISADILYNNGEFAMNAIPFSFNGIHTESHLDLDLNSRSNLLIHNLNAQTGNNTVTASGKIDDLMNILLCNLKISAKLHIPDLKPVLPPQIKATGYAHANIQATFTLEQIMKMALEQMRVSGTVDLTDLEAVYNDSIKIKSSETHIQFTSSDSSKHKIKNELLHAKIQSKDLNINMIDFLSAKTQNVNLDIAMSDFLDTNKLPSISCDFDFDKLNVNMDTISVSISKPLGNIVLTPSKRNPKNPSIHYSYQNNSLSAQVGKEISAQTQKINLSGHVSYNDKEEELVLQWNPTVKMDLQEGKLTLASFPTAIHIPVVKFDFSSRKFNIKESRIVLGNSDFNLSGLVTDINKYLKKSGLMKAELDFVSNNVDVQQLMDYISGFGSSADSTDNEVENKEDNPFMVPLGVDIVLNTTVKKALVGNTKLQNLHGQLTIKDGVLVLEEMGFTSEAARMQLTAIYRSPRKNHLFAGIDFHLLDIDIAKLIEMIPIADTLVPMLKFFEGKAEFHLAFETYMKSNYDLKRSTLRGASAITGQNLAITDNKIFPEIYNKLIAKNKPETKIDSLALELTIFREEVDIYPFLISINKYKVVVGGRHNLDMTYDYHISVTETPLPLRLGVDIKGKLPNYKIKLVRCKYPKLYRPGKENAVDKKILELKNIISNALKGNVKKEE